MNTRPPSNLQLAPYRLRDTDAEKGTLRVPVRHAEPDGPAIELLFVRLQSRAAAPGHPILFLTGGPGLSGIRSGEGRLYPLFNALRERADVILLDQRACVASGIASVPGLGFELDGVTTREAYLHGIERVVGRGVEVLAAAGIPTDSLNTNESADDVAMLVRALYGMSARVSLLGWSYGSHLAMAIIKRHEERVASAVLAAPEGPDHTYKRPLRIQEHLERIAARVAPFDLLAALERVLGRVERDPVSVTVYPDRFYERPPHETTMGRFDLEWMFSEAVADTRMLAGFPSWLASMDRGDFSVLGTERRLRHALEALRFELPTGVARYAMDCASGATAERRVLIEREARTTLLGNTIDFPFPEICPAVGCPDLGDDFRAAPHSDVPVLFITGTLDCRTPAENVAELAPGFRHQQHVVVEDAGHGDLLLAGAVQGGIAEFFAQGRVKEVRVRADAPFTFDPIV